MSAHSQLTSGDLSMAFALEVARGLGTPTSVPGLLAQADAVAAMVDAMDGSYYTSNDPLVVAHQTGVQVRRVAAATAPLEPDIPDALDRISIGLRIWSGCISAAKTIAMGTNAGPNSAALRTLLFTTLIDPNAATDTFYGAGVEAAPAFKVLRNQVYSFDGVPPSSRVRLQPR